MRWVAVLPANALRRLVVVADIATNLPREVGDGRKDAAREEIPFNLREPQLDLVEPG